VQDVNGDGFNDIGTTVTGGWSDDLTAYFSAGAGSTFNVNNNGLLGIEVGTATYHVSSVTVGGTPALLNFWMTNAGDILGYQGIWREVVNDALHNLDDSSAGTSMYFGANVTVDAPAAPEPSTLVLLGFGALALLMPWWRNSS
jgi:hypothetical protein